MLQELAPAIIPALEPFLSEVTDWSAGRDGTAEETTEGEPTLPASLQSRCALPGSHAAAACGGAVQTS